MSNVIKPTTYLNTLGMEKCHVYTGLGYWVAVSQYYVIYSYKVGKRLENTAKKLTFYKCTVMVHKYSYACLKRKRRLSYHSVHGPDVHFTMQISLPHVEVFCLHVLPIIQTQ